MGISYFCPRSQQSSGCNFHLHPMKTHFRNLDSSGGSVINCEIRGIDNQEIRKETEGCLSGSMESNEGAQERETGRGQGRGLNAGQTAPV